MQPSTVTANNFLVIRATVENEIAAPGVLAISSSLAGDGKTAVAAGIACSLAASGYRTLVLDAAGVTQTPAKTPREALTAAVADERLSQAVRATDSGCDFLAVRDLGAEVSSSVAIAALYAAVRGRYDYAVVDTSVLNGSGLAFARGADGVVLSVREGRAIVPADKEAVELLDRLDVRFLGVVATTDRFAGQFSTGTNLADRLKHKANLPAVQQEVAPFPKKNGVLANSLVGWFRRAVPARTSPRE